jgi:hypothetical protein
LLSRLAEPELLREVVERERQALGDIRDLQPQLRAEEGEDPDDEQQDDDRRCGQRPSLRHPGVAHEHLCEGVQDHGDEDRSERQEQYVRELPRDQRDGTDAEDDQHLPYELRVPDVLPGPALPVVHDPHPSRPRWIVNGRQGRGFLGRAGRATETPLISSDETVSRAALTGRRGRMSSGRRPSP